MKPVSILNVACILIVFCLLAGPAYPWSSANGGTHLEIDNAAYDKLSNAPGFNPGNFPSKKAISGYTGLIYGADALLYARYETYLYSNHYYNPVDKQGNAPERAKYWYNVLVAEITNGEGLAVKSEEAAKAAAYLGHYVADVGVPYHVNGNFIANPSPAYKDWNDPDYHEVAKVPTGPHPEWEYEANKYSYKDYNKYSGFSSDWDIKKGGSSQIEDFVKKTAARTKDTAMNSVIDDPYIIKRLLGRSVQDVYTVYKAAYDEGTIIGPAFWFIETRDGAEITCQHDFKLIKILNDKYALVDMVPHEPPFSNEGLWNGIIMEKYNGKWVVAATAITDEWKEKIPELRNY